MRACTKIIPTASRILASTSFGAAVNAAGQNSFAVSATSLGTSVRRFSATPPPFLVEQWEGWEAGKLVLSNSDCEPIKQSSLLSMADDECKARWDDLDLGYGHQKGCEHLRADILGTFNNDSLTGIEDFTDEGKASKSSPLTVDDINVVVPAEGIYLTMNALLEEGDEVVVAMPCYQSLHQLAESKGCMVKPWLPTVDSRPGNDSFSLGPDNTKFHNFSISDLESLITPSTKMVVMNFPHNPTGAMITEGELQRIVRACEKNDCYLFNDEMYKYLEHKGKATLPSVAGIYEKGISLGGVSKWGSLAGIRIGWVVSQSEEVMSKISQLKDYTTISSSRPAEVLASIGIRNRNLIIQNNLDIIHCGKGYLKSFAQVHSEHFEWIEPEGGSFAFLRLRNEKASPYVRELAEKANLCVMPSDLFVHGGDDSLRVCFGRKDAIEMIDTWSKHLE
ncbi:hypothetical protein TrVE_jg12587 [Triparma verrucosa]|uniref:Aminotransferase class I/classII large domain-containing protein n=1 Tax=Triparma verrucosa TaxID=1606542 RepID=A0A9W7KVY1_9STRA|nr:hypothetical protein TrVE_jg12587 [Triparma verrucosa]